MYKGCGKDFDNTPAPWKIIAVTVFVIVMVVLVAQMISIVHGQNETEPKGVFKSKAFTVKNLKAVKGDKWYDIQGTIKNITNESITGIYMDVETYNATGNYNGVVVHKVEPTMDPGQEYSFDITVYALIGDLDHYIVTMSSDR
jgi:hypothetical protein